MDKDYIIKKVNTDRLSEIVDFNFGIFDGMYEDEPYSQEQYKEKLKDKEPIILIAEDDGKILGDSISFARDGSYYIWILGVSSEYRGKGIGNSLIEANEEIAKEHKFKKVIVKVYNVSEEMQGLLKKRGYEVIKTKESDVDPKYTAVLFELKI